MPVLPGQHARPGVPRPGIHEGVCAGQNDTRQRSPEPASAGCLTHRSSRRPGRRSSGRPPDRTPLPLPRAIHLGLLCSAAAALGTLAFCTCGSPSTPTPASSSSGLVVVHLAQRRRSLARMATGSSGPGRSPNGDPPRRFGPPAPLHHPEHARVRRPGLEPRRANTAAAPRALRQVARYLRARPRRLPGGARLAPEEAPPAVDDPIADDAGWRPDLAGKCLSVT
jgi:hypothetical protein